MFLSCFFWRSLRERPTQRISSELPQGVFVILMYSGSLSGLSLLLMLILQGMTSPLSSNLFPFSISYSNLVIDPLLLRDRSTLLSYPICLLLLGQYLTVSSLVTVYVILICVQEAPSALLGERADILILLNANVLMLQKVKLMCQYSIRFFNLLMGLSIFFAAWIYGNAFRLINAHILFSISFVSNFLNMACSCSSLKMSLSYLEIVRSEDQLQSGNRKNCLRSWKEQLFRFVTMPCRRLERRRDDFVSIFLGDLSCFFIVVLNDNFGQTAARRKDVDFPCYYVMFLVNMRWRDRDSWEQSLTHNSTIKG